jgi:HSP20 family protein
MWRDPWEELRKFERRMNRLFDEFWTYGPRLLPSGRAELEPAKISLETREPYTDIQETDKEVILTAEMPGVDKKDIKINATEDGIEISAGDQRREALREGGEGQGLPEA